MPRTDSWTTEMYARLASLYADHTNEAIMEITGWSNNEIGYRSGVLNLKKSKAARSKAARKYVWTDEQLAFLTDNYATMANKQLADGLGLKLQFIRAKLYTMGLYRMNLEFWTDEQVEFLKNNYQLMGNTELADIYEKKWPKSKKWTIKHIEKKCLYLKLNRTEKELAAIKTRNVAAGRYTAPDNTKGSVQLSDNYVAGVISHGRPEIRDIIRASPELIDIKRKELLLTRAIKQTQNGRTERTPGK